MNNQHEISTYFFDGHLSKQMLPVFRGAVIKGLGEDVPVAFHNHLQEGLAYSYPKVQYKIIDNHPAIVLIDISDKSLKDLHVEGSMNLSLNGRKQRFKLVDVVRQSYSPDISDTPKYYELNSYLPFNETNREVYNSLVALTDRICKLEDIITANILSMFKGLGTQIEQQIEVAITDMRYPFTAKYKDVAFDAFNLRFVSNILLPDYIGLGKSPSVGFGTLKRVIGPR